jgi:hypothetical protein
MANTSATPVKKRMRVSRSNIRARRGLCPTLKDKVNANLLSFFESARLQGENYEHRQE